MGRLAAKNLLLSSLALIMVLALTACGDATSTVAPVATPVPPQPAATQPPMASKLLLYGDLVKFGDKDAPDTCTLKNRFTKGESVGFRMTAVDPLSGKYVETAKLVVHLTFGAQSADIPMSYRGTGANPRPGFWTAKWVVPADAPTGIVKYSITGSDDQGRSGEFQPFQIQPSQLAVVS